MRLRILFFALLWLACTAQAFSQSKSPEELIADFHRLLISESPESVTTTYLGDLARDKESRDNFNKQFRFLHDNFGKSEGYDIIDKNRFSDNLISYNCIFRYEIPVYFRFLFYRYEGNWKITYFFFSQDAARNLGVDTD
ncbi:MAG: hypothetical protein U0U46_01080 [Saprospiraceae bacterium]